MQAQSATTPITYLIKDILDFYKYQAVEFNFLSDQKRFSFFFFSFPCFSLRTFKATF